MAYSPRNKTSIKNPTETNEVFSSPTPARRFDLNRHDPLGRCVTRALHGSPLLRLKRQ